MRSCHHQPGEDTTTFVRASRDTERWLEELSQSIALVTLALQFAKGLNSDFDFQRLKEVANSISHDRLSRVELQLLPILASALDEVLPNHPANALALGAKRRAAAEALLADSAARIAAESLRAQGLPSVRLKGLALVGDYEAMGWRRPMGDADLLIVEPTSWKVVEETLIKVGFNPAPGSVHARNFDLPNGRRVDIHRFISTPNAYPVSLQRLIPLVVASNTSSRQESELPAEVHMAHAIEHAMRWNPILPARSISDIAVIQHTSPNVDWQVVHDLLCEWAANRNGRAFLAVLARAGIVPMQAVSTQSGRAEEDVWLQTWATADPRRSWIKQSITFFGLVPRRLSRKDPDFVYSNYLRGLWSLRPEESISAAITHRIKQRVTYRRNLPQYIHE